MALDFSGEGDLVDTPDFSKLGTPVETLDFSKYGTPVEQPSPAPDRFTYGYPGGKGASDEMTAPAPVSGAGRGMVNPPDAIAPEATPTSGNVAKDMAINAFAGLAGTGSRAIASAADIVGADQTAKQFDEYAKNWQGVSDENGGRTIAGGAANILGSVAPAFLAPEGELIQFASNAGLFGIPAFRETLNSELDKGTDYGTSLARAVKAFSVNMVMPTAARYGGEAAGKVLGTEAMGAATKFATETAAAGTVFGGIDTVSRAADKASRLANGEDDNTPWVDPKSFATTMLAGGAMHAIPRAVPFATDAVLSKVAPDYQAARELSRTMDQTDLGRHVVEDINPNLTREPPNQTTVAANPSIDALPKAAIADVLNAPTVDAAADAAIKAAEVNTPIAPIQSATPDISQTIENLLAGKRKSVSEQPAALPVADQPLQPQEIPSATSYQAIKVQPLETQASAAAITPLQAEITKARAMSQARPIEAAPAVVMQNRDRSSTASIAQMNEIAANPDYLRAGQSSVMDSGAPVVFGDIPETALVGKSQPIADGKGQRTQVQYAVVEASDLIASHQADGTVIPAYATGEPGKLRAVAGNGRAAGIIEGYNRNTTDTYKQDLVADAQSIGVDPQGVAGMKAPVLVRVMDSKDVTPDIGDRSNIASAARLSSVEQAATDSRRINLDSLEFQEDGSPTQAAVTQFVRSMPTSEQSELIGPNGTPTKQAIDRLMAATFKQAYGSDELVSLYAQAQDPEARTILSGLADAAGSMSSLKDTGEHDIRGAVAEAAGFAVNARRQGQKLSDMLKTKDMMMSDEAFVVAKFMADNVRSAKKISEGLRNVADYAAEQAQIVRDNASQGGMFGETPAASRYDIFKRINGNEDITPQNNLQQPARIGEAQGITQQPEGGRQNGAEVSRVAQGAGVAETSPSYGLASPRIDSAEFRKLDEATGLVRGAKVNVDAIQTDLDQWRAWQRDNPNERVRETSDNIVRVSHELEQANKVHDKALQRQSEAQAAVDALPALDDPRNQQNLLVSPTRDDILAQQQREAESLKPTTVTPAQIYEDARKAHSDATATFRTIQDDYRAQKIGDAEFMAGRAAFDRASKNFDVAERTFVTSAKKLKPVENDLFNPQDSLFEPQPEYNPIWRSALKDGIDALPYKASTGEGWQQAIKGLVNKGTAKADEVAWSGIDDYLKLQTGKVTKEQVSDFLAGNGVKVTETVLGDVSKSPKAQEIQNRIDDISAEKANIDFRIDYDHPENWTLEVKKLVKQSNDLASERASLHNEMVMADIDKQPTKYGTYQLPGGENYREVLLTLPTKLPVGWKIEERNGEFSLRNENDEQVTARPSRAAIEEIASKYANDPAMNGQGYKSNHWEQPNVLAHIRLNDRVDADGKKIMFIEELQSDFGQAYKKQRDNINKAVDDHFETIIKSMEKAGVLEVNCD
jgi:ddrB-like ParB superfamily domain